MSKIVIGAVCVAAAVVGISEAYKIGYNKAMKDCNKMMKLVADVTKAVGKES